MYHSVPKCKDDLDMRLNNSSIFFFFFETVFCVVFLGSSSGAVRTVFYVDGTPNNCSQQHSKAFQHYVLLCRESSATAVLLMVGRDNLSLGSIIVELVCYFTIDTAVCQPL